MDTVAKEDGDLTDHGSTDQVNSPQDESSVQEEGNESDDEMTKMEVDESFDWGFSPNVSL